MTTRAASDTDFAPAALLTVAIHALREIDPELVPSDARAPDWLKSAHVSKAQKRRVLDHAIARGGPTPLIAAGMRLARLTDRPVVDVLLRSADSTVLAAKWTRLEAYYHSDHRTAIDTSVARRWSCRHHALGPTPPTAAEDLLICGVHLGLIEAFGCPGIRCEIGSRTAYRQGRLRPLPGPPADTSCWLLTWSDDPAEAIDARPSPVPAPGDVANLLSRLLVRDIARNWSLAEVAAALGLSPRSLQRALSEAETTFSSLVRANRVAAACRLLSAGAASLADIGYACGYADQAHFQRDFRRVMAMTPTAWRALETGG